MSKRRRVLRKNFVLQLRINFMLTNQIFICSAWANAKVLEVKRVFPLKPNISINSFAP